MRTYRRTIIFLTFSLLCGMLTNIGVAWWLALRTSQIYTFSSSAFANTQKTGRPSDNAAFPVDFLYSHGCFTVSIYTHSGMPTPDHRANRRTYRDQPPIRQTSTPTAVDHGQCQLARPGDSSPESIGSAGVTAIR